MAVMVVTLLINGRHSGRKSLLKQFHGNLRFFAIQLTCVFPHLVDRFLAGLA